MVVMTSHNLSSSLVYPTKFRRRRTYQPCFYLVFPIHLSNVDLAETKATSLMYQSKRRCKCLDIHKKIVPYSEALYWQKSLVKERKSLIELNEDNSDMLIVLQHHPVYTLGTGSSEEYLNFDISKSPHDVYRTDRGGEVTYHGPGQLIMYPIINLRYHKMDLHWYLRALEEVIIRVLYSTFSIKASRLEGLTGVWVGDEKLAAIGIKVSKWITHHGLALNVTTDLTPFQHIVPCGIRGRRVGSIKELLGEFSTLNDHQLIDITHLSLLKEFCEVFQFELSHVPSMSILNRSEGIINCS